MFKIIKSNIKTPVKFPIKPGIKIVPGNIVKLITYNNNLVFDICDNGKDVFGLASNRCIGSNELDFKLIVKAYPQRMVIKLSTYDRKYNINIGDSLYCNIKGLLTSRVENNNSIVLAKVIEESKHKNKYITILWV